MARWRIAGTLAVLAAMVAPAAGRPAGAVERLTLKQLRLLSLPDPDPTHSGSVAFDGHAILYARSSTGKTSTIHRLDARTGKPLPDLHVALPSLWQMTYDAMRHHLYVVGVGTEQVATMYELDLATLKVGELFDIPANFDSWAHWSFDASMDRFRVATEGPGTSIGQPCLIPPCESPTVGGTSIWTYDREGRQTDECSVHSDTTGTNLNVSTLAAAGNGEVYVQGEDDATLYRVSADCELVGSGEHPRYNESDENDSMTCDTVTFPVPAVWIRDGAADAIVAYEVPGGYCPLPTRLAPVRGQDTRVEHPTTVCTTLSLVNREVPLPGQPVTLSADGKDLATVRTDGVGRACAPYVPRTTGRHPLRARFAGGRAYLASGNVGSLGASLTILRTATRRPGVVAQGSQPDQPAARVAPKPVPVQAVQLQVQPVAQAQMQPQVQPQIQAQGVLVPQVQEQIQLARSTVDPRQRRDLSMSRYRPRRGTPTGPAPIAVGVVGVLGMGLLVRPDRAVALARSVGGRARR